MSGHSKWHNIKLRKGKVDALRGALFTKLSRELILAAKAGSPDPEANYRLKMAVEKARESNMPLDTVKRAIARASGDAERPIEEIRYEGYGPFGVAVIVDAATDNRNRTAAELRFLFSRHGGTLGETNSVAWMFDPRGIVELDPETKTEDEVTEAALVDGVVDVRYGHPTEVLTEPGALQRVREALAGRGLRVCGMHLAMEPQAALSFSGDQAAAVLSFLDELENHEDVQLVHANVAFDERVLEALA